MDYFTKVTINCADAGVGNQFKNDCSKVFNLKRIYDRCRGGMAVVHLEDVHKLNDNTFSHFHDIMDEATQSEELQFVMIVFVLTANYGEKRIRHEFNKIEPKMNDRDFHSKCVAFASADLLQRSSQYGSSAEHVRRHGAVSSLGNDMSGLVHLRVSLTEIISSSSDCSLRTTMKA